MRLDRQEVSKRHPFISRPERRTLHDRVCLLAREARLVNERDEHARRGVEPEAAGDVLAHPLGADEKSLDETRHPDEQVVEDDRRVGEDDALGARVADVALVPERLVLERRLGVAAEQPGEPGDSLGQDRIPFVGHRR